MSGMKKARQGGEFSIEEIMASIRNVISNDTVAAEEINGDGIAVGNGELYPAQVVQQPNNYTEYRVSNSVGKLDTADESFVSSSSFPSNTDDTCRINNTFLPPDDSMPLQSMRASLARSIAEAQSISDFISRRKDQVSPESVDSAMPTRSGEPLSGLKGCSDVTSMTREFDDSCTAVGAARDYTDNSQDVETIPAGDVPAALNLGSGCQTSVIANISDAIPDEDSVESLSSSATDSAVRSSLSSLEEVILSGNTQIVEDLVSSALRPMLMNWLDRHLPDLVEGMVQQEIKRIVSLRS